MSKVLIMGSGGMLGQELVKEFSGAGYEVVAWDKKDADVTAPDLESKISGVMPDILIYSVGYNAVDKAETLPDQADLAYKLNSQVPGTLSAWCKTQNKIFVYYSTDYVFKGDKPEGYIESDLPDPQTVYGKTKYAGEKQVISNGEKYYLIRLSRLFGIMGSSPESKLCFVDDMLQKRSKPKITIKNEETGSPTYAPDLAKYTRMLIEKKLPFGIYHGANSGTCTPYEWLLEIQKHVSGFPEIEPVSSAVFQSPATRPKFTQLLSTKTTPMRTWQDALAEFLKNRVS